MTPTDALPQVSPPRGAGQTLLVVDDDPALVALTVEMLNGLGYQTMGYSDPLVALQTLRETPERFCAVVTDEVMPGLTGIELAELCALHAPQIPVLMISGYGGALLASRAAAVGIRRILNKPLQRTELALALAALLH